MRACVTVGLVALAAVGCGGGGTGGVGPGMEPMEATLREVADLWRSSPKPPGRLTDLAKMEANYPRAYGALKTGDVVAVWGTAIAGEGEPTSGGTPLAYEKNAPTAGGWALLTSGEVKKVAATDIPAAKGGGHDSTVFFRIR